MNFVKVDELNRKDVLKFLIQHEHTCVQLVEKILRHRLHGIFCIQNNANAVTGVLSVEGTVLHCLPEAQNKKIESAFRFKLKEFLSDKKISCVNGEATASNLIIDILKEKQQEPLQINEYILMTLSVNAFNDIRKIVKSEINHELITNETIIHLNNDSIEYAIKTPERFTAALPDNWNIIRCYEHNADALIHLQIPYEEEEVTPQGKETNAASVRKNLERLLQEEYVIALQNSNEEFISKANTNGIGLQYAQIGGVFTAKKYRNHHFASLLVEVVVHRIVQSGRRPVLYVQTANEYAKKIYTSLGFSKSRDYLIAYY